ncbi:NADH-quinone oxidoreductase subunit NuoG [Denitromonas iodatirespirans]|uniref:NADH-quinone oxidoreductase n=1 Tax=Denitromonas iodatirespirans TaxID=2795389 RepID=A0A944DE18_DENI1|nr:NADH-quinone oxidoreductase subunit NuoG [Denitromonas iodatirespirans]MBT0963792.1 NADH-quinone oxidoreductase subunit G [Denitromonas iodatirespirans]
MLEIEIDGKQLQVADGSTVMDAANQVGVYIPHFCYHKKLSIAANCRMCLVQVEKAPKPLPACATPVTNGMKVWTNSEAAVKAQKGVMEFLLINHPLDCPICDQGGECQLQDLAVGYGESKSRYQEEKRVVFNKNLGPLVSTDMTRCIHCTRCVRFTQEIAGLMELGQAFRGEHSEIMPFVEKTVDSELSGNIIDLCPVGALTSKPFRFAARTWELARRKSVSPHDSLGSNLIVQVKHDVVKRVLPLENEAINECWLSDRDRFSYEGLNSASRLTKPMIRQGDTWQEADWQSALEFAASRLKAVVAAAGPEQFGALAAPSATVEELYLAQKLVRALGSDNIDFRLRQTDFSADGVAKGAPWLGLPVAEVGELDRLLVVGSFLRKDHPLLSQRVRQAAKRGLKIASIHPTADDWLLPVAARIQPKPAEMVAALAAVLKAVADAGGKAVDGSLQSLLPAVVSAEAKAVAELLGSGQSVAIWLGNFAAQHPQAATLQRIAQEIAAITGARFGVIGEAANSVGGHLAGALPRRGGKHAAAMLTQSLKSYLLLNVEPSLDCAGGAAARDAIAGADFVVSLSAFDSPELRAVSHVLLPVSPFTETSGTFVSAEGRAQSFVAVAKPQGDTRPAWKVLRVLGNLLSLDGFEYTDSEAVRAEVLDVAAFPVAGLDNTLDGLSIASIAAVDGLERVAEVPIYATDAIVRRAPALQRTRDAAAPLAYLSAATLSAQGLNAGDTVQAKSGQGSAQLNVAIDDTLAEGCVRIATAHESTAGLGAPFAVVTLERV